MLWTRHLVMVYMFLTSLGLTFLSYWSNVSALALMERSPSIPTRTNTRHHTLSLPTPIQKSPEERQADSWIGLSIAGRKVFVGQHWPQSR